MSGTSLEKLEFLVIEDNPFMRSIIKSVLRALGATVIKEANDGSSALEVMKLSVPDIIFVDWEMQPINGLDFVKMVRRSKESPDPFVPIIMLSGHSEHNRVLEARDAGVNEFVVKPISAEALYKRIQEVIEVPRPFIKAGNFVGPDRRRHTLPFQGEDRRKTEPDKNSDPDDG
ncbi:MAG: response regulator [Rhodospirillales bacterium]|nr:response regulator [Rhodospirillales bacterium]MDP6883550.1 response regulator [Rhodospirillales bacterium]